MLTFSFQREAGRLRVENPLAEAKELEVADVLRAVLEQVPRQPGGVIGLVASFVFVVGAVLLCQWLPTHALPVALGVAAVAHLALLPSYFRLHRLGLR